MSNYQIAIRNQSGRPQKYALITGRPEVTGDVQSGIWSIVLATASTGNGQVTEFTMSKQYYALCGTSNGGVGSGTTVSIGGLKDVKLGQGSSDGSLTKGTTISYTAESRGNPSFDSQRLPDDGSMNAFQITTSNKFTSQDAEYGAFEIFQLTIQVVNLWTDSLAAPQATG